MKPNDCTLMYNTHPVVAELNRVKGFDPLRFLKQTAEGPKMELKYKKLWFRLKHPNGRIKLSTLTLTEQLAVIEARIFFDKNDTEPNAVFTARSDLKSAPGGLYIEAAQHMAVDQALTDAGFGIQFVSDQESPSAAAAPKAAPRAKPKAAAVEKALESDAPQAGMEKPQNDAAQSPVHKESSNAALAEAPAEAQPAKKAPAVDNPNVEAATEAAAPPAPEVSAAPEVQAQEEAPQLGGYTNEMTVDEICARMTLEDAENYIVPLGTCNGQTMKQVADRRPASLRYYMNGYNGDNNILRAAATVVSQARLQKAS